MPPSAPGCRTSPLPSSDWSSTSAAACRCPPGTASTRSFRRRRGGFPAQFTEHIQDLQGRLARLVVRHAPQLLTVGVGPDTAVTLLITVRDNPERMGSEAFFAVLCGVSPVDARSGRAMVDDGQLVRRATRLSVNACHEWTRSQLVDSPPRPG
ncbi:transposase [Streptomyces sp. NPDC054833]